MPPFERRLGDGFVGVAGGCDDGLHNSVLGSFDYPDEIERGDGDVVFAEDEAGVSVVDVHLGGVVGEVEDWVGGPGIGELGE